MKTTVHEHISLSRSLYPGRVSAPLLQLLYLPLRDLLLLRGRGLPGGPRDTGHQRSVKHSRNQSWTSWTNKMKGQTSDEEERVPTPSWFPRGSDPIPHGSQTIDWLGANFCNQDDVG